MANEVLFEINLVNYHFNNVCNMTFPPNSLAQQQTRLISKPAAVIALFLS